MKTQIMAGTINRKTPPRESLLAAWNRAVATAMATQDADALERLLSVALDMATVEAVMS